jgi:hypothetical protein
VNLGSLCGLLENVQKKHKTISVYQSHTKAPNRRNRDQMANKTKMPLFVERRIAAGVMEAVVAIEPEVD